MLRAFLGGTYPLATCAYTVKEVPFAFGDNQNYDVVEDDNNVNDIVGGHDDEVEINAPHVHTLSMKFLYIFFIGVDGQNMWLLGKERSNNFKEYQNYMVDDNYYD